MWIPSLKTHRLFMVSTVGMLMINIPKFPLTAYLTYLYKVTCVASKNGMPLKPNNSSACGGFISTIMDFFSKLKKVKIKKQDYKDNLRSGFLINKRHALKV